MILEENGKNEQKIADKTFLTQIPILPYYTSQVH